MKRRAAVARWKAKHPERSRYLIRRSHLKRMYQMTPEQYDALLEAQGGTCALCDKPAGPIRLHVDHDHSCCPGTKSCGRCVRGLLCAGCNRLMGWVDKRRDDIEAYTGKVAA